MNEIESLEAQLEIINSKINRVHGTDSFLDEINKHFHLGTVGGSGTRHNINRLNRRREISIDKRIKQAGIAIPLYRQRDAIIGLIKDIKSGLRDKREEEKKKRENIRAVMAEQVRNAKVGDTVVDSAYGEAEVIRVNKKTLTIKCKSGYQEARPFDLIIGVKRAI